VHLSVIHCQQMAAENLLSVLSTLPNDIAVNDKNDLLQVTASLHHCCNTSMRTIKSMCLEPNNGQCHDAMKYMPSMLTY